MGVGVGVGLVLVLGVGVAVGVGVGVAVGVGVGVAVGAGCCDRSASFTICPPAVGVKFGAPVCSLKMPISRNQWTM